LKQEEHLALFDAFQQVLAKHPQARLHLALWQSLCEYYDENLPYKDRHLEVHTSTQNDVLTITNMAYTSSTSESLLLLLKIS
jgi:hypothetical protein